MTLPESDADADDARAETPSSEYRWVSVDSETLALYDPDNANAWIQTDRIVLVDP